MKIFVEVYDMGEDLLYLHDNKITTFSPKALKIEYQYEGYFGNNWGDQTDGKGGFPQRILYRDGTNSEWVPHHKLFRTKEELIASL